MKRFLLICLGLACFIGGPFQVYAMSEKEIVERLEALTQTVAKQQEEIRYLKQQLEAQKAAAAASAGQKRAGVAV